MAACSDAYAHQRLINGTIHPDSVQDLANDQDFIGASEVKTADTKNVKTRRDGGRKLIALEETSQRERDRNSLRRVSKRLHFFRKKGELSMKFSAERDLTKVLLLAAASFFEHEIKKAITGFAPALSNSMALVRFTRTRLSQGSITPFFDGIHITLMNSLVCLA